MSSIVSVIIPVYNVEKYLAQCIESVLRQNYRWFEILLINDGSTDSSQSICEAFAAKDSRIKVLNKPNEGMSSARNYGLKHAIGEYVIFLDSDDYWIYENSLKEMVNYANKLKIDVLRVEYISVNEKGEEIHKPSTTKKQSLINKKISSYDMVDKAISGEWFAVLFLIKRAILQIEFDTERKFQEDIDFYCRLFSNEHLKCGYLPLRLYAYRKRESSITTTANLLNLAGSFSLCDVFFNQSQKIVECRFKQLYIYHAVMMYFWTLQTVSSDPYFQFRRKCIREFYLKELVKVTRKRANAINKLLPLKTKFIISLPPVFGIYVFLFSDVINRFKQWIIRW